MDTGDGPLKGVRVLIVEDEYYLADDLARAIGDAGGDVLGPVGTVDQATALIAEETIDAAILDLNLGGVMADKLVQRLAGEHLPCVIVSGYSGGAVPDSLRAVPRLEKPVDVTAIVKKLAAQLGRTMLVP